MPLVRGCGCGLWLLLTGTWTTTAGSKTALSFVWALVPTPTRHLVKPRGALRALSRLRRSETAALSVQYVPCTLRLDQVTVSYPANPWRRLTSAVPYREWALNVSFAAQSSDLVLITGDSSSGKSTLLQLIAANASTVPSFTSIKLQPTSGTVSIAKMEAATAITGSNSTHHSPCFVGTPVYLNEKPTLRSTGKSSATVETILLDTVRQCYCKSVATRAVIDRGGGDGGVWKVHDNNAVTAVLADLMECVGLVTQSSDISNCRDLVWTKTPVQLTVSELYRLALVQACLQSIARWLPYHYGGHDCDDRFIALPSPILLLDEWLDTEPSVVVHSVQEALARLCRRARAQSAAGRLDIGQYDGSGGVSALILSVTHYPQRWKQPMPRHGKKSSTVNWRRLHLRQGQMQLPSPSWECG
jgi:energy-coupling factor transporter ATP-binding protein EcfA2